MRLGCKWTDRKRGRRRGGRGAASWTRREREGDGDEARRQRRSLARRSSTPPPTSSAPHHTPLGQPAHTAGALTPPLDRRAPPASPLSAPLASQPSPFPGRPQPSSAPPFASHLAARSPWVRLHHPAPDPRHPELPAAPSPSPSMDHAPPPPLLAPSGDSSSQQQHHLPPPLAPPPGSGQAQTNPQSVTLDAQGHTPAGVTAASLLPSRDQIPRSVAIARPPRASPLVADQPARDERTALTDSLPLAHRADPTSARCARGPSTASSTRLATSAPTRARSLTPAPTQGSSSSSRFPPPS